MYRYMYLLSVLYQLYFHWISSLYGVRSRWANRHGCNVHLLVSYHSEYIYLPILNHLTLNVNINLT